MDDATLFDRPFKRVQLGASAGATLVIAMFAWATDQWWRAWTALAIVVPLAVLARIFISREHAAPQARLVTFFGIVLAAQTAFVALTGGIRSPGLILWGGMGWVAGFAIGRFRAVAAVMAIPIGATVVWACWPRAQLALELPDLRTTEVSVVALTVFAVAFMLGFGGKLGSEIRRRQDDLRESALSAQRAVAESLRERNETLLTLTSAVAHELKNPLSAVLALSTMLEDRARTDKRPEAEQLRVMSSEARRMGGILDELLNFSRPGDERAIESVPLGPLVQELQLVHQGMAEEREVRFALSGDTDAEVRADRRKLSQILTNLLQNALDASPSGGVVDTSIRALDAGGVEVSVTDQGSGIDPSLRGRLFVPGVSGKVAGSGLGLAISRMLAERYGGVLQIEDLPAGGCRSLLRLPADKRKEA